MFATNQFFDFVQNFKIWEKYLIIASSSHTEEKTLHCRDTRFLWWRFERCMDFCQRKKNNMCRNRRPMDNLDPKSSIRSESGELVSDNYCMKYSYKTLLCFLIYTTSNDKRKTH